MTCRHSPTLRRLLTAGGSTGTIPRWGLLQCERCGKRRRLTLYSLRGFQRYEIAEPDGPWFEPKRGEG